VSCKESGVAVVTEALIRLAATFRDMNQ